MHAPRAAIPAAIVIFVVAAVAALLQASPPSRVSGGGPALVEGLAITPTVSPGDWDGQSGPTPTPFDARLSALERSDGDDGDGTAVVAWLTPEYLRLSPGAGFGFDPQKYLIFRVTANSPSLNRSTWDLKSMIYLRDGSGKEYGAPTWLQAREGRRKVGVAAFPRTDARGNPVPGADSRFLEIVIRDLSGAKERVFRWDLGR